MVKISVAAESDGTFIFRWPDGARQSARGLRDLELKLRALHIDPYKFEELRSELLRAGLASFEWSSGKGEQV
jgi:hypothetical protein